MSSSVSPQVRVRFAPSPTGYLHVGGARTALYDFLFARQHQGVFVLRIEDTDLERSTEESMKMQIADLQWLGLKWDEGIDPVTLKDIGPYAPYRQSQRLSIYQEQAEKLLLAGKAYYCFLSDEEIEAQREAAKAEGRAHQVISPYRDLPLAEAKERMAKGEQAVVRFRTHGGQKEYKFTDLVRGEVAFPPEMVGDFVLLRSSGMPVYNFCCVVDDALMKITHVFRAEDHLSNTLRQLMLYEALEHPVPEFAHLSIILGEDRQKLSKRHGATSIKQFADAGYLPEAMNNFLALLGWSSPKAQEILSLPEMIEQFTTDRLHSAAAVFDETKLKWMNATHLRALPAEDLWKRLEPLFAAANLTFPEDLEWRHRALDLFKTSMETLNDATELFRLISLKAPELTPEGLETLKWENSAKVIKRWCELVEESGLQYLDEAQFSAIQNRIAQDCAVKGKQLFQPIRVAVIGTPQGAELKNLVPLILTKTLAQRAQKVLAAL